jgi:hypothetical protein
MHPYLTGVMAQAHIEDLHREAARHRLAAAARAGRTGPVTAWRSTVTDAIAGLRRAMTPTPARACAPQSECCPA